MARRKNDPAHRPVRREPGQQAGRRPQQPPLFDQDTAPIPRQSRPRSGIQQVILPLGGQPVQQSNPERENRAAARRITRGEMRRRRIRRRLLAFCAFLMLAVLGIVLSVTVLFKVNGYRVEGPTKEAEVDTGIYSEDAILAALGIPMGENLFQFSLKEKEQQMMLALPYMESIQLRRSLPGTIVIRVKPAVELLKIPCAGGWAVVSEGLKVLSVQADEPRGLMLLSGIEAIHPAAGQPLVLDLPPDPTAEPEASSVPAATAAPSAQASANPGSQSAEELPVETEPNMSALHRLLAGLQQDNLIDGVESIDLSDLNEISFVYEDRVRVLVGTINTLDYKMEWARYILLNQKGDGLDPSDRGRLDISHVREDGSIQPLFSPGPLEEQPLPPQEPEAENDAAEEENAASSVPEEPQE